jgi:hypothetical protein
LPASPTQPRGGWSRILLAYCLALWAHDLVYFLLRDGRGHLLDGDGCVLILAPVLGPLRDFVLLAMALSGNFREWPGEFVFFFPWAVALGIFGVSMSRRRRRAGARGGPVAGDA